MDRETALRKIKACLRLAASPNATEAATALRQAKAMMDAHGINERDSLDVDEAEAPTRARGADPTKSISMLATLCARSFGARSVYVQRHGSTVFRFHGLHGAGEIAAYAFTVLRRQLDKDRLKHISRVRKRANREHRGEIFAQAWIVGVADMLPKAELGSLETRAINLAVELRYPNLSDGESRDLIRPSKRTGRLDINDRYAGHVAGKAARLHRPVGADPSTAPDAPSQLGLELF